MSRCTLRNIITVLLYAGVGLFLFPYLTGHLGHALMYLLIGIGITVVCGVLRCCFLEGDCTEPVPSPKADAHVDARSAPPDSGAHSRV